MRTFTCAAGTAPDYSVETCKVAVAETKAAAETMARGISVTHSAGRLSYNGPVTDDAQWTAVFLIHAPKDARVDLETKNGPIDVRDLNGTVKLRRIQWPDRGQRSAAARWMRTPRMARSRSVAIAAKSI